MTPQLTRAIVHAMTEGRNPVRIVMDAASRDELERDVDQRQHGWRLYDRRAGRFCVIGIHSEPGGTGWALECEHPPA